LDPAVAFGLVLRTVRKEAKLTQEQLALTADVERNFVSLMERGINQPTVRVIFKLARALGTSPSELMIRVEKQVTTHPDQSG
jgi:transcriptional regulator with XRE-family HTH domain